mgnify:CR=1 FL=1
MSKTFAHVDWSADDVRERRPNWTVEQAEEFLEENEERIRERMIEIGWNTIDYLLAYDPPAHDPHCTCNDCIHDLINPVELGEAGA